MLKFCNNEVDNDDDDDDDNNDDDFIVMMMTFQPDQQSWQLPSLPASPLCFIQLNDPQDRHHLAHQTAVM